MVVLDENIAFVWICYRTFVFFLIFYFDLGIIWGRLSIENQFYSIEKSQFHEKSIFDIKIDFLLKHRFFD